MHKKLIERVDKILAFGDNINSMENGEDILMAAKFALQIINNELNEITLDGKIIELALPMEFNQI